MRAHFDLRNEKKMQIPFDEMIIIILKNRWVDSKITILGKSGAIDILKVYDFLMPISLWISYNGKYHLFESLEGVIMLFWWQEEEEKKPHDRDAT